MYCVIFQKPSRIPFLALFIFLSSGCFSPHLISAQTDNVEQLRIQEKKLIEKKIEQNKVIIQRLQTGLEEQREGYERTQLQEKSVLAELEELDLKLLQMAERLQELNDQMETQKKLISQKESELEKVRKKSMKVQAHMQKRIGAYYKLGKIDLVNITFSTQTLPDLLRFHDSFQEVISYDKDVMKRYRLAIDELEGAKRALTLEQGLLEEFIEQANLKEKDILLAREEKAGLLRRIATQAVLHKQAMKEITQAKEDLRSSLLSLQKKEELIDQGFLMNKGHHVAPVDGVVTSRFNEERIDQFGITKQTPGIIIAAPDGEKIRAIFPGKVVYAGYLKGYGNTVIIDHGYQYFTITSRIERMLVKKESLVRRKSSIGIMGSTATILDNGLYFEIRHKDIPLDPLKWLDSATLSFATKDESSSTEPITSLQEE